MHIALFHGAERSWFSEQGEGKQPHAPFDAGQIERAGLHHAFVGHYHRPKDAERHTYPGNPDPLAFGEDSERGAVVATIGRDGCVERERHSVAVTEVYDLALDVTGCTTRQQVRDRLAGHAAGLAGFVRLTVRGDLDPGVDLREDDLRDVLSGCDAAQIQFGEMRTAHDIETLRHEQTIRGQFVNDVLKAGLPLDEQRRVLTTGLRALVGRSDLEAL